MALSTPIIQIVDRDPISVEATHKISEAIHILSSGAFHHLPVVDNKRLVGMLSTVDILKLDATLMDGNESGLSQVLDRHYSVADVMVRDVIPLSERATVADAAKLLSSGGFHALPVMASNGDLIGIVTSTDLIAHMLEAHEETVPGPVQERMQTLERVYEAAQNFLASGMSVTAHEQLERVIEAARRAA